MAFRVYSIQSLSARGIIPSVAYAASNPNRPVNPAWNFARIAVIRFTETATWTCPENVTSINYLIVGGGGAGGAGTTGGGGGAGGFRTGSAYPVSPGTTYTITVGAGGSGYDGDSRGNNGSDSTFDTITSAGGGGGGNNGTPTGGPGKSGGSGGGGGRVGSPGGAGNIPSVSPSQGRSEVTLWQGMKGYPVFMSFCSLLRSEGIRTPNLSQDMSRWNNKLSSRLQITRECVF